MTGIHAHVGGGVGPEREPAGRVVELEGRNAEVKEDAVEVRHRQVGQAAEVGVDEREARAEIGGQGGGARLGGGIAVEGGDVDIRGRLEQGAGVAAAAKVASRYRPPARGARNSRTSRRRTG
jgi:hypothetical protein